MLILKLDELLNGKNISQKEFAKVSGISFTSVRKYCSGEIRIIKFNTLNKICETLSCNINELIN